MLKNHELKRAHSFPDSYVLKGNITEQTKQIGNSVPVKLARALVLPAIGM
jgi:DNA (cytosine-5)-methyltransferase 1